MDACALALRPRAGRTRQRRQRRACVRRQALRRAARARRRRALRRPRPRPRPEVRRRGAARLPAADHRRQAHAVRRRAGAAGAPRPRDARRAARRSRRGGARAVADAPVGRPNADGQPAGPDPAAQRPLTVRRLLGLDRSGPPPAATLAGAPLNPWTIPNAIGFARLLLIPVFLVVALSSDDGVGAPQAILFAVIGWGDYADGMAARVTRQYSRLGALMDPVTDRLLVICGVVVNWHFELLPRWALAVLVAREV